MSKFTSQELDLASDPTVLLIKYRMMEKVWDYLEELKKELQLSLPPITASLLEEYKMVNGKISKGENYKHLPYMVLDYPATFSLTDIFAFRTMFYWGNFISSTFHLQGKFLNRHASSLIDKFRKSDKVYFCVSKSPWEYHYQPSNYVLLKDLKANEIDEQIKDAAFIKLSIKFAVEEMPEIKDDIIKFLLEGMKVIQTN